MFWPSYVVRAPASLFLLFNRTLVITWLHGHYNQVHIYTDVSATATTAGSGVFIESIKRYATTLTSGVRRSGDARAASLYASLPYSSKLLSSATWWSLLLDMRCLWRHNITAYLRLQTNGLAKLVSKICILCYRHSLLIVVECVTLMNINYQRSMLADRSKRLKTE